jgi:hypothetical protein
MSERRTNWRERRRELARLRAQAGPSVYERRFLERPEPEDQTEWVKLYEVDMITGRVTRHGTWKPFGQTPLRS